MKIAFDVKGTLAGHEGDRLLFLLKLFIYKGYEVTVWSNSYGFADEYVTNHDLIGKVNIETKYSTFDAKEQNKPIFDIAFEDDHMQTYLAAKKLILVHQLDEHFKELMEL